jgi:signal transduction histidine kinase
VPIPPDVTVYADLDMLTVAVSNLVQNAFKFTQRGTEVTLHAYAAGERVLIEVGDHCGGLPPGPIDALLKPFTQSGGDRSGLGLGLDICRRGVEANGGSLSIRNSPGVGCAFTIDLPRHPPRSAAP